MQDKLQQNLDGIKTNINELLLKTVEIEEEIKSIKDNNLKVEAWTPQEKEKYWYINHHGNIEKSGYHHSWLQDIWNVQSGNYFKTQAEAEQYKANIITKEKLKRLALRLNCGVEIDWINGNQAKTCFYYENDRNKLNSKTSYHFQSSSIYSLSSNFLNIAKAEIGEQELINYIKSGV